MNGSNAGDGGCQCRRVTVYARSLLVHMSSHLVLCSLVVGYAIAGAFLFDKLEGSASATVPATANSSPSPLNWTPLVTDMRQHCLDSLWDITGYGHVTPKTDVGKLATIFYALLGVPMVLLCLSNVGHLMAKTFRLVYRYSGLCCLPSKTIGANAAEESDSVNRLSKVPTKLETNELNSWLYSNNTNTQNNDFENLSSKSNHKSENTNSISTKHLGESKNEHVDGAQSAGQNKQLRQPRLSVIDDETRELLVECAEYVLSEQLGVELKDKMQESILKEIESARDILARKSSSKTNRAANFSIRKQQYEENSRKYEEETMSQTRTKSVIKKKHPPPRPPGRISSLSKAIEIQEQKAKSTGANSTADQPVTVCRGQNIQQSMLGETSIASNPESLTDDCSAMIDTIPVSRRNPVENRAMKYCEDKTRSVVTPTNVAWNERVSFEELTIAHPPVNQSNSAGCNCPQRNTHMEHSHQKTTALDKCHRNNIKLHGISGSNLPLGEQCHQPSVQCNGTMRNGVNEHTVSISGPVSAIDQPAQVPLLLVISLLSLYIGMGSAILSWSENWRYVDAAYFCFITLSTIGFGDVMSEANILKAETHEDQLKSAFCCLYLFLGLAIIAMSFNLVQERVVTRCKVIGRNTLTQ